MAIHLIDQAVSAGARQSEACRILDISPRTLRRWRASQDLHDRRKGAGKACPHALTQEEKDRILDVCNQAEYRSLPPSQIVPRLADQGTYLASESSFYRILRDANQQHRRGRAKAPNKPSRPTAFAASAPNRVWTWDITFLPSAIRGQFHRLYLILDVYSRSIVGWEIHDDELASHASELITKACLRHRVRRDQLVLHADNGSPMKGSTMLSTLQRLGVVPSFSRPSVSDDNPYSEALFRTLKYTPAYPGKPFASLEAARQWVEGFVTWYNTEHRHSGIRFVTPAQRHAGTDCRILAQRATVYEHAKKARPDRWRGRPIRNWTPAGTAWLNPEKPVSDTPKAQHVAA